MIFTRLGWQMKLVALKSVQKTEDDDWIYDEERNDLLDSGDTAGSAVAPAGEQVNVIRDLCTMPSMWWI